MNRGDWYFCKLFSSLNFVVYALRSDQYRKAYADYIRRCCCPLFGMRNSNNYPYVVSSSLKMETQSRFYFEEKRRRKRFNSKSDNYRSKGSKRRRKKSTVVVVQDQEGNKLLMEICNKENNSENNKEEERNSIENLALNRSKSCNFWNICKSLNVKLEKNMSQLSDLIVFRLFKTIINVFCIPIVQCVYQRPSKYLLFMYKFYIYLSYLCPIYEGIIILFLYTLKLLIVYFTFSNDLADCWNTTWLWNILQPTENRKKRRNRLHWRHTRKKRALVL